MEPDLEKYLNIQKENILKQKYRLNSPTARKPGVPEKCDELKLLQDFAELMQSPNKTFTNNERGDIVEFHHDDKELPELSSTRTIKSAPGPRSPFNSNIYDREYGLAAGYAEKASSDTNVSNNKKDKDIANEKEVKNEGKVSTIKNAFENDMEQWISDTFYSYFPSLNEESKRREELIRNRQIEYQNYLKQKRNEINQSKIPSKRSDPRSLKSDSKTDKTEVEINAYNPTDGNSPDASPRPGSNRERKLHDLTHTELSNIVNTNVIQERNRLSAEMENKRKKQYQEELMMQIQEKRLEAEIRKEKEKREEAYLANKLEQQLRTIQLEEELEREKLKLEQARIEAEQNRIRRMQLLSKLENDHRLSSRQTKSENDKDSARNADNKVYKYFSNSAHHRGLERYGHSDLFESDEVELQLPQNEQLVDYIDKPTKECLHLKKNVCPFCDVNVKNCENCSTTPRLEYNAENSFILCDDCKSQFPICISCQKRYSDCIICNKERNTCTHNIWNFCTHCGKSLRETVSSRTANSSNIEKRVKQSPERAFQILDLDFREESEEELLGDSTIELNYKNSKKPAYSMNIDRKSVFHPAHKIKEPKVEVSIKNGEIISVNKVIDNDKNIETIKEKTNDSLSKYLKNYGDLAVKSSQSKSTQTAHQTATTNQNVYPSMPLLRDRPRKSSTNEEKTTKNFKNDKITVLSRKWEVPAIQRQTISKTSPRVITQLGAVRKQLQAEKLQLELE